MRVSYWKAYSNNINIASVIPQVGSQEGAVYAAVPPTYEGRELVSYRPSAQIKHINIKYWKESLFN